MSVALGVVLGAALLLPPRAAAQGAPAPPRRLPAVTRTLSTDPLVVPLGIISGEAERAVGAHGLALGVGGLTTFGGDPQVLNDGGSEAFRSLQLKLKYYPREDGLRGFAVGVTAGVAHERELLYGASTVDEFGRETVLAHVAHARTAPTVGATVDYNFLIGRRRRFLIGLGVGARRALGVRPHSGPLDDAIVDPRLQIGFGF